MSKKTATVLAVILSVVIVATYAALLCGLGNAVVGVLAMLSGFMMLVDLSLICGVMGGSYKE